MAMTDVAVNIPPTNLEAVQGLSPEPLWRQFATLASLPRPSKKEESVRRYIQGFCDAHGLACKQASKIKWET